MYITIFIKIKDPDIITWPGDGPTGNNIRIEN